MSCSSPCSAPGGEGEACPAAASPPLPPLPHASLLYLGLREVAGDEASSSEIKPPRAVLASRVEIAVEAGGAVVSPRLLACSLASMVRHRWPTASPPPLAAAAAALSAGSSCGGLA
eukprot:scaffold32337_cov63-Phaeocystis_antarctica.AAC.3